MPYIERDPVTHRIIAQYGSFQPGQAEEFMTDAAVAAEIAAYPPYTFEVEAFIKGYRDMKMGSVITYNGVEAKNDFESQNAINRLVQFMLSDTENNQVIDWKGPNGFFDATLEDLQGLALAGGIITEKAFTAERAVLEAQDVTPFPSLDAAATAFDTSFNS